MTDDLPDEEPFDLDEDGFLADLADDYDLEECCLLALAEVMEAFEAFGVDPAAVERRARDVARALGHGRVGTVTAELLFGDAPDGDPTIGDFASGLADAGSGAARAAALLLRAQNADRAGRVLDAEADLEEAARLDPDHPGISVELAQIANDRGDAARAARLLVRAGLPPDHDLVVELRERAAGGAGVAEVGRNEPCPCGSGRKYKQCHLGKVEPAPIEARSGWLINKVVMFVGRDQLARVGLASAAATAFDPALDEPFETIGRFVDDPFIMDLAVLEKGGLERFLRERGPLLPDDERDLAEAWADARRRLWEVLDADPGASLTLRDTTSGDEVTITEHTGSHGVGAGDLFLAVVVPVGSQHQWLSLPLAIDLRWRQTVMDLLDEGGDPDALAAWYGRAQAPPTLLNREGQALRWLRARVRFDLDWDEVAPFLDEVYEPDEPAVPGEAEAGAWTDLLVLDDLEALVRARLVREGDELIVETNAEERLDDVLDDLLALDPDLTCSVEEIESADLAELADEGVGADSGEDLSPELTAALDEVLLTMEERWLDEAIPALDGLTPRQAAADPTRREDLRLLLRSFEGRGAPGRSFDPDRLREALDLER